MGMHPYDINNGFCEDFAGNVIARMGGCRDGLCETTAEIETDGGLTITGLPGHVWIKHDGMHFDAEEPEGVTDWRQLPIFGRLRQIPRYRNILTAAANGE
jgi:hypothetical protein